jgi:hypothetical protein
VDACRLILPCNLLLSCKPLFPLSRPCIESYARCLSASQRSRDLRQEPAGSVGNRAQAMHEALELALLFVVVAMPIADAHAPRMPPDPGRQEKEPQPRPR